MKRLLVVLLLVFVGSCLPASQQEVTALTGNVTKLIDGVDKLQEVVADKDLVSQEKLDKINAEVDKVQEHTAIIVKEVETADGPMDAIKKGWDASEPFNPYYGYGTAVIAILTALGIGKKKAASDEALKQVVVGVEKMKTGADVKTAMTSQSIKTKNIVSAIRNAV